MAKAKVNREVMGSDGLMYDLNGFRTSAKGTTNYLGVQRRPDGLYMAAPACHDYDFASMGYANYMPPIHISESLLECAAVATHFYTDKNGNLKDLVKYKENWGRVHCDIPKVFEYEAIGGEVKGSVTPRQRRGAKDKVKATVQAMVDVTAYANAANSVIRPYVTQLGGLEAAKEVRDLVIAQAEFFVTVDDAKAMAQDIVTVRIGK